jgi:hypothetical protein
MTPNQKVQLTILAVGLTLSTLGFLIPGCTAVALVGLVLTAVCVGMHVRDLLDDR